MILMTLLIANTFAFKVSESFQITLTPTTIKVVSPSKRKATSAVVIENTIDKRVLGEIRTRKKVLKRVSIESRSSESVEFKTQGIEQLYFVSVSPPFQEVELKFGAKNYEIP